MWKPFHHCSNTAVLRSMSVVLRSKPIKKLSSMWASKYIANHVKYAQFIKIHVEFKQLKSSYRGWFPGRKGLNCWVPKTPTPQTKRGILMYSTDIIVCADPQGCWTLLGIQLAKGLKRPACTLCKVAMLKSTPHTCLATAWGTCPPALFQAGVPQ